MSFLGEKSICKLCQLVLRAGQLEAAIGNKKMEQLIVSLCFLEELLSGAEAILYGP